MCSVALHLEISGDCLTQAWDSLRASVCCRSERDRKSSAGGSSGNSELQSALSALLSQAPIHTLQQAALLQHNSAPSCDYRSGLRGLQPVVNSGSDNLLIEKIFEIEKRMDRMEQQNITVIKELRELSQVVRKRLPLKLKRREGKTYASSVMSVPALPQNSKERASPALPNTSQYSSNVKSFSVQINASKQRDRESYEQSGEQMTETFASHMPSPTRATTILNVLNRQHSAVEKQTTGEDGSCKHSIFDVDSSANISERNITSIARDNPRGTVCGTHSHQTTADSSTTQKNDVEKYITEIIELDDSDDEVGCGDESNSTSLSSTSPLPHSSAVAHQHSASASASPLKLANMLSPVTTGGHFTAFMSSTAQKRRKVGATPVLDLSEDRIDVGVCTDGVQSVKPELKGQSLPCSNALNSLPSENQDKVLDRSQMPAIKPEPGFPLSDWLPVISGGESNAVSQHNLNEVFKTMSSVAGRVSQEQSMADMLPLMVRESENTLLAQPSTTGAMALYHQPKWKPASTVNAHFAEFPSLKPKYGVVVNDSVVLAPHSSHPIEIPKHTYELAFDKARMSSNHFVLKLMSLLFSREELRNSTLKGGMVLTKHGRLLKEKLDPVKVNAILSQLEVEFPGTLSDSSRRHAIRHAMNDKCRRAFLEDLDKFPVSDMEPVVQPFLQNEGPVYEPID